MGLRWWIISLVTLGTALNYLARSSLAVAAPTLTATFDLSTQQFSWVVAAFQATYTIMQPVAGFLLDLLGTRLGFALFAIGWSFANMAHAFAGGWPSLAMFRGMLGLTEAAVIPAGLKVVSEWFPAKERTVATGWFNIGASLGAMIAPPLVAFCILMWNWQSAFIVTGGIGLFWAALWYWGYRKPEDHPRLSEAERTLILEGRDDAPPGERARVGWRAIIVTPAFWSIAVPRFLAEPAWQIINFFIPLYLANERGMDLKEIAAFAVLPFIAADLGSIAGGYLAPWSIRRFGVSLLTSRKIVVTAGALLMIGPACIALGVSAYTAVALLCVGGFAHQMLSGSLLTLATDLFDRDEVATAAGMGGSAAWIGGLSVTLLFGAVADTIGYDPLFVALAILDLAGAAFLWVLLSRATRRQAAR